MKKQVITPCKRIGASDLLIILALIILFYLFFFGGPTHYSKVSFIKFWNIGHIIFFALSNYLIIKFLSKDGNITAITAVILFTAGLGIVIELIQSQLGRSVDWQDIYRNFLGAGLAITVFLPSLKRNFTLNRYLLLILICGLILFEQLDFYHALNNENKARERLPVLADFEEPSEINHWSGHFLSQSQRHKTSGQYSMKVELLSGIKYSGFTFEHFPNNWEAYNYLAFSLYNPNNAILKLSVKITDYEHNINTLQAQNNRFNLKIKLEHGWNHIRIPLIAIIQSPENRKMDISNISEITFFMYQLQEETTLYIDDVSLQK